MHNPDEEEEGLYESMWDPGQNRDRIGSLIKLAGFTSPYRAVTEVFHGYDHQHSGSLYPRNKDHQGLVFFTRPRLNLSYDNLLEDRHFLPMTDDSRHADKSIYRAIRLMLDPVLGYGQTGSVTSRLFDTRQAFMPLLSNLVSSLSGFPDLTVETYTSPEGQRKESWSMVDDIAAVNNVFDITANFQNIAGDPITTLFHLWVLYQGNVYSDVMVPYPDVVIENEVDYQTRIWRIVLDSTKRYVKKIACAHASYPVASPLGATFNYEREQPFNTENDEISIPFRCQGAEYNDPILFLEFNQTVEMFNPDMRYRNSNGYVKLSPDQLSAADFYGFPYIDLQTLEMQWWVSQEDYRELFSSTTETTERSFPQNTTSSNLA